jgi:hypothetical protein
MLFGIWDTKSGHKCIGEIDPFSQIHQAVFAKNLQSQTVSAENLCKTLLNKKVAYKMLLKLTI